MEDLDVGTTASAVVMVNGYLFENRTYDVCRSVIRHTSLTKCPVAKGQHTVNTTATVPVISPKVRVSVSI